MLFCTSTLPLPAIAPRLAARKALSLHTSCPLPSNTCRVLAMHVYALPKEACLLDPPSRLCACYTHLPLQPLLDRHPRSNGCC